MTFGLSPSGFNAMRLADIKQALEDAFVAQFGDINLDPQSVFGQEIGVLAKSFADLWENLEDVYFSQYPNSASGTSLDNVVLLNGITRLPATQTSVVATLAGNEGTLIPVNAQAAIPNTNEVFYTPDGGTISRQNADIVIVQVVAVAAQAYQAVISNIPFTYSFPVITFSNSGDIFYAGDSIVVTINGIAQTAVNFTTDSDTTLGLIAAQIALFPGVASATPVGSNVINVVPSIGFQITINPISITGPTPPSYAITFAAPANQNAITAGMVAILNAGTPAWLAVDNADGTFTINSLTPSQPFSANVGVNLNVIYQASPVTFLAVDFGPIPLPVNSLTQILTPIAGWDTITNLVAGATGTLIETDAELRIRRQNSIKLLGLATVDAIQAHLLQNVPGVTSAVVIENRTLYQVAIVLSFPAQFVASDVITVSYEPSSSFAVNWAGSQTATMAALVTAFELLPQVSSATYGGTGNQVLTINMNIFQDLVIDSADTSVSDQSAVITGGRPPKSFEAIVEGGSDQDVANEIWLTKPAGIQTYGNTSFSITDSQGNPQLIFFSRPQEVFIWVSVALTLYPGETFPVNGILDVQQAIFNYGESLGVGVSVLLQRVLAQIFTVPGIASGVMTIAATFSPTASPVYGSADITIADTQISIWDLAKINVTVV